MKDCLFCRISSKELPASIVWEDDTAVAFDDIHPKAPVHVLVVPKKHLTTLDDAAPSDAPLLGRLLAAVAEVARLKHLTDNGYRVIINTRHHAGQEIDHLHLHLMGGEPLGPMRAM